MDFDILGSEKIYKGRAFNVEQVQARLPDGRVRHYDLVLHPGAVVIVPVDSEGRIWFVRQYRVGAGQVMLELPAGTLEPGEEPEVCAAREVREETGMAAASLRRLGGFYMAPGYTSEYLHIFLANGLTPQPLEADADEFLQTAAIPIDEVYRMASAGALTDGKTLASLLLVRQYLK
jgi:ADP-ribose pyrophosphatase